MVIMKQYTFTKQITDIASVQLDIIKMEVEKKARQRAEWIDNKITVNLPPLVSAYITCFPKSFLSKLIAKYYAIEIVNQAHTTGKKRGDSVYIYKKHKLIAFKFFEY